MTKLFKLSEETQNLIEDVVEEFGLNNFMNIKCFGIKKQKQVIKVKKASPTEEGMGNSSDCVIVIIAEGVFERLDDEDKKLILKDAFSEIFFDSEKDKIVVTQPEVCVTIGGWQKWGEKLINAIETSILIKQQIDEEEKEKKKKKS